MTGRWNVQLPDGAHAVEADLNIWIQMLTVTYDGARLGAWFIPIMLGKLRSFEQAGHAFEVHVKGFGALGGHLALAVDGTEVDATGAPAPVAPPKPHAPPKASAPPPPVLQFVKELSSEESDEVLGVEEYPLDNSFGDAPLSTDRQVAKQTTNELSIDLTGEHGGKFGLAFAALQADVSTRVCRQIGHKAGETVTESQTLHMQVAPHGAVMYRVIWKRKVRTGEHLYLADGEPVTVPYRVSYGLACEIRTSQIGPETA
jgi:hypothetical protein